MSLLVSVPRCARPRNSEKALMSAKMDRRANSWTDSDLAFLASLAIPSVAQVIRRAIRPTARSIARRRIHSIWARTAGSLDHRYAVALGTPLVRAHLAADVPCASATVKWVFWLS